MNKNSDRTFLRSMLITALTVLVAVKLFWVLVEFIYLPDNGVEKKRRNTIHSLPHSYRLVSNDAMPKPVKKKPVTPKRSIRDLKLLATYRDPVRSLAVINKGSKTLVIGIGEEIFGYRLSEVLKDAVILQRDGKEYRLAIKSDRSAAKKASYAEISPAKRKDKVTRIRKEGETTLIPRDLVTGYTENVDKIWKEIGIAPKMKGKKLEGFRIRYLKKGSVFEKLGLKRGDTIIAINGEPIEDYGTAMELFQSADTLDNLTLKVKRGKKEVELEYEVQ